MTELTRDIIRKIRDDMNVALAEIGRRHGVTIEAGNASFNANEATFKVNVRQAGKTASDARLDKLKTALDAYRPFHPDIDFDAKYRDNRAGRAYEIVGYNTKARDYPFILQVVGTTDKFKFSKQSLKMLTKV